MIGDHSAQIDLDLNLNLNLNLNLSLNLNLNLNLNRLGVNSYFARPIFRPINNHSATRCH